MLTSPKFSSNFSQLKKWMGYFFNDQSIN